VEKNCDEQDSMCKIKQIINNFPNNSKKATSIQHTMSKANPTRKITLKIPKSKITDFSVNKIPLIIPSIDSDEQWIDGPRISKSKVAEARHMLKHTIHKTETWIDGPMHLITSDQSHLLYAQHSNGYGFMDSHKKRMIKKWVENQSSQIHHSKCGLTSCIRQQRNIKVTNGITHFKDLVMFKTYNGRIKDEYNKYDTSLFTIENDSQKINRIDDVSKKIGKKLNIFNIRSNTISNVNLTCSSITKSTDGLNKTLDMSDDDDDDEEIVVPPPLPLIEPLSNGISREVSIENLNIFHKDIISAQSSKKPLLLKDDMLEIFGVRNRESVFMQDSCLQVTEADIALCMKNIDKEAHLLRILSQENLTLISTLAGKATLFVQCNK
jgi:kinesin family protein 26